MVLGKLIDILPAFRSGVTLKLIKVSNKVMKVGRPCFSGIRLRNEVESPRATQALEDKPCFARSRGVDKYPETTSPLVVNTCLEDRIRTYGCHEKKYLE
jgi:hypothetical protein